MEQVFLSDEYQRKQTQQKYTYTVWAVLTGGEYYFRAKVWLDGELKGSPPLPNLKTNTPLVEGLVRGVMEDSIENLVGIRA